MFSAGRKNLSHPVKKNLDIRDDLNKDEQEVGSGCPNLGERQRESLWASYFYPTLSMIEPKASAIIPARFGSTRFPGKPLAKISQKPMIQHVYERVAQARCVSDVIVATDDSRIVEAVK